MAPIKILYCIDCLVRGGTELQLIGLIERLDRSKYEPYLLTIRPSDLTLIPVNCHHLDWSVPRLFSMDGAKQVLKLSRLLRDERFDIVQTFFQDSTVFASMAARMAAIPVRIASCRDLGFWHTASQGILMRCAYSLMTAYVCNAEVVRRHFTRQYKIDPNRTQVLRNGVEVSDLAFVEQTGPVENIGIVGNMTRQVKRTDLFIEAAAIVARKYPDIRWHVIGEGHMLGELQQLAKSLGLCRQLVFAGGVSNVAEYLSKLQLGVICSDSEGLSNALLEYMFKGVASVATNVGGNPELVKDNETGLLVPPNDAQALAHALIQLIENTALRRRLAHSARQQVETQYSWQHCLTQHEELYNGQLQAHNR